MMLRNVLALVMVIYALQIHNNEKSLAAAG
jgi:hypothetical protein